MRVMSLDSESSDRCYFIDGNTTQTNKDVGRLGLFVVTRITWDYLIYSLVTSDNLEVTWGVILDRDPWEPCPIFVDGLLKL